MDSDHFKKVLIIGPSFSSTSGEGITLTNLFHDWPPEQLAVATEARNFSSHNHTTTNYYIIGSEEKRWVFPFSFMQKSTFSGPISLDQLSANKTKKPLSKVDKSFKGKIRLQITKLLSALGLYHQFFVYQVSDTMKDWIKAFDPDIIYTQATSIGNMKIVLDAMEITNAKLAVHIMDDYLGVKNDPILTYNYWKRQTNKNFKRILDQSDNLLSICQEMSEEYQTRYQRDFTPFHNPVVLTEWLKFSRVDWKAGESFKVMYAGRIGRGTSDSLVDIARAVSALGQQGLAIEMIVQTTTADSPFAKVIEALDHCSIHPPVPYADLPKKLASADLLVLPMDFSPENFNYIRLSMPTKCSEYMATGVPILVYAPAEAALSRYAKRENWAEVVTQENNETIQRTIKSVYNDIERRKQLGTRGKWLAENKHSAEKVRKAFRAFIA